MITAMCGPRHLSSHLHFALLLGLFTLMLSSGCAHGSVAGSDASTLQSRQQALLAALSERNLDATMAHFASDAVVHVANMPAFVGAQAIRDLYANVFRAIASADYLVANTEVAASGDLAYSHGAVTTVFRGAEGERVFPGKFVLIWAQREGHWQLVLYAISNNQGNAQDRAVNR